MTGRDSSSGLSTIPYPLSTLLNAVRLYVRYLGISLRAQMQYRASFLMGTVSHFLGTGIGFLALWALFDRFGSIKGWRLPEVALFYGITNVAFSLAEGTARGFDVFAGMVRSGDFDRYLLRPRSTALQLAGQELQLRRLGRFSQALIVLLWAAWTLGVVWSLPRIALTVATVIGSACLFYGLLVLQATMCFWTTESLEIVNCVTYGGTETAQYPLNIYRRGFRRFFTFVIPLACTNYFPVVAILGKADPLGTPAWLQWGSPLVGLIFLVISLRIWRIGVRHYRSTGS